MYGELAFTAKQNLSKLIELEHWFHHNNLHMDGTKRHGIYANKIFRT